MKVKVRNYKLVANYFDSFRGTNYTKQSIGKEINICYDENMYIEYDSDFVLESNNLGKKYIGKAISQDLLLSLEEDVNLFIEKYRAMGMLFLESDKFHKDEKFTILQKDELFEFY